ncbi:hypothetical protein ABZX68_32965, partial [Streptomyces cellulosae]
RRDGLVERIDLARFAADLGEGRTLVVRLHPIHVRRGVLRALAVAALHGHRLRRVLLGGRGRVPLPRGGGDPGVAGGAPGGGRLKRHPPCRTEEFVGPRQTHSA